VSTHPQLHVDGIDGVRQGNHHSGQPGGAAADESRQAALQRIVQPPHPVPGDKDVRDHGHVQRYVLGKCKSTCQYGGIGR